MEGEGGWEVRSEAGRRGGMREGGRGSEERGRL